MTTNIVEQMLVELMLDTSKFAAQADKAEKKNQALEKSLDKTEKASKQAGKANEELAKKYHSSAEKRTDRLYAKLLASKGKHVTINCSELLHATNGHHTTAVLCTIDSVRFRK